MFTLSLPNGLEAARMSVERIRTLLKQATIDDEISLDEVQKIILASADEGGVTIGERFTLAAALDAHQTRFGPGAYEALKAFLSKGP